MEDLTKNLWTISLPRILSIGGRPHEKFVDYLLTKDITIEAVLDAAQNMENDQLVKILTKLKEDGLVNMDQVGRENCAALYRFVKCIL